MRADNKGVHDELDHPEGLMLELKSEWGVEVCCGIWPSSQDQKEGIGHF